MVEYTNCLQAMSTAHMSIVIVGKKVENSGFSYVKPIATHIVKNRSGKAVDISVYDYHDRVHSLELVSEAKDSYGKSIALFYDIINK